MKITKLSIKNLLGVKEAEINNPKKIVFVSGANGAGKSSIRDAVALAMTGDLSRVTLKKDASRLVNEGADAGSVAVEINGDARFVAEIEKGKLTGNVKDGDFSPVLPYLLDMHHFANVTADERRKLLFDITGCKASAEEVMKRMVERGINEKTASNILPYLRSGFPEAQKEAQTKAREAKASWRTVTGETYGEKKAEGWTAKKAEGSLEEIQNAVMDKEKELSAVDADFEAANQRFGAMKAAKDKAATLNADIVRLRDQAEKIDRIKKKLEADQRDLKSWQAMVERAKQAAHGVTAEDTACNCPECGCELVFVAKDKKLISRGGDLHGSEDEAVNLAEYQRQLEIFERSVKNDERDLTNAEMAKVQLSALEAKNEAAPTDEAIVLITAKLDELRAAKKALNDHINNLLAEEKLLRDADETTAKALQYHNQVIEWERVADALAPDGIPGEILQDALKPFRNALVMTAGLAGWGTPSIDDEMGISVDGRPYGLLSESEKWRADCLMTEAISNISGFKFFAVDRMDVLDGTGRSQLFALLDELASVDAVDSVLVMGTLKKQQVEAIDGAFESISVYWMQDGVLNEVNQIKKEVAA